MTPHHVVVNWSDAHIRSLNSHAVRILKSRGDSRRRVGDAWLVSSERRGVRWKETGVRRRERMRLL